MNQVLSHIITFLSGLFIGVFGTYFANRLSEKAKLKDLKNERKNEFRRISKIMPDLLDEMRDDLTKPEFRTCRIFFILPNKNIAFNYRKPFFSYFEDEHENLESKILILENADFIIDITEGITPKYKFSEEFVELLLNNKYATQQKI